MMAYTKLFGSWEADNAWRIANCKKCKNVFSITNHKGCDIEEELLVTFFAEDDLSDEMKQRIGYDGTVTFRCKEFTHDTKKS